MKVRTILTAINRHMAIHVCLAGFFAFCWLMHHLARLTLEIYNRNADWANGL